MGGDITWLEGRPEKNGRNSVECEQVPSEYLAWASTPYMHTFSCSSRRASSSILWASILLSLCTAVLLSRKLLWLVCLYLNQWTINMNKFSVWHHRFLVSTQQASCVWCNDSPGFCSCIFLVYKHSKHINMLPNDEIQSASNRLLEYAFKRQV